MGGRVLSWKPYLVWWVIVCSNKRKGSLGVSVFQHLTRLFSVNGIGVSMKEEGPFGRKLLVGSMGKKKGLALS